MEIFCLALKSGSAKEVAARLRAMANDVEQEGLESSCMGDINDNGSIVRFDYAIVDGETVSLATLLDICNYEKMKYLATILLDNERGISAEAYSAFFELAPSKLTEELEEQVRMSDGRVYLPTNHTFETAK